MNAKPRALQKTLNTSLSSQALGKTTCFIATLFLFALIALVLFSQAVNANVSHDEYQFIAGAQILRKSGLLPYIDYPFLHMPYMPVFYATVLWLGTNDFLTTRLLNEFSVFLSVFAVFLLVTSRFKAPNRFLLFLVGGLSAFLFVTNPSLYVMDGRALNHGLPTLFALGAFFLYLYAPIKRSLALFLCGILVGLATGTRLSYAVLVIPFILAIWLDPTVHRKDWTGLLMAFGAGIFLAVLPILVLFVIAPKPFIYGNFHYIALNTVYRRNFEHSHGMTLLGKLEAFFMFMASDPVNALLYLALIAFLVMAWIRFRERREPAVFALLFNGWFGIVLFAAAFSPTPLWQQYFFSPVPFLIIGIFWGISEFFSTRKKTVWLFTAALGAAFFLSQSFTRLILPLQQLQEPAKWTTTIMYDLSNQIASYIDCSDNCKVLTLVPILPLEADLETYPMFTVGSFSWRTAPLLTKERRAEYEIISYEDLNEFLMNDPPAAILTGLESNATTFNRDYRGDLEQPFVDYAVRNGYRQMTSFDKADDSAYDIILWMK